MTHRAFITTLNDFIEIQLNSFCWFLSEGLIEELEDFSSILDFTGNIEVKIFGDKYKLRAPAYSIFESKQRDLTSRNSLLCKFARKSFENCQNDNFYCFLKIMEINRI